MPAAAAARWPRPAGLAIANAAVLAGLACLAGCAVAPVAPTNAPGTDVLSTAALARFHEADAGMHSAPALHWARPGDAELARWLALAGQQHPRIAAAAARLAQAEARARGEQAQDRPQLGLSAGASRQGGPLLNAAGNSGSLFSTTGTLSWAPDVGGGAAQARRAAQWEVQAEVAELAAVRLQVQADTARTLLALRATVAELTLARATLASWDRSLPLAEQRLARGSVAAAEVDALRSARQAAAAELPPLQRRLAELQHALAGLSGQVPAEAQPGLQSLLSADAAVPVTAAGEVPAGIPSAVLARRPDVRAAQARLLASQARLAQARTAWLPQITLTASGGQASPELLDLLRAGSRAWGLGALLSLPLLDGGRREAHEAQAGAAEAAAAAAYRGQILQVFQEVEDRLVACRSLDDELRSQAEAVRLAEVALRRTQAREQQGLAAQPELQAAQRETWRVQRRQLQLQAAREQATVALVQALGGETGTASAPVRQLAVLDTR